MHVKKLSSGFLSVVDENVSAGRVTCASRHLPRSASVIITIAAARTFWLRLPICERCARIVVGEIDEWNERPRLPRGTVDLLCPRINLGIKRAGEHVGDSCSERGEVVLRGSKVAWVALVQQRIKPVVRCAYILLVLHHREL